MTNMMIRMIMTMMIMKTIREVLNKSRIKVKVVTVM